MDENKDAKNNPKTDVIIKVRAEDERKFIEDMKKVIGGKPG